MTQSILTADKNLLPRMLQGVPIYDKKNGSGLIPLLNSLSDESTDLIISNEKDLADDISQRREMIFNELRARAFKMSTPAVKTWIVQTREQHSSKGKNIKQSALANMIRWESILLKVLVNREVVTHGNKRELAEHLNKQAPKKVF